MISVNRKRTKRPDVLAGSPTDGDYYDDVEVVKALREIQGPKCCYCECEIPRLGQGKHVDHFQPKSIYPARRNDWQNLLLSCPQCNGQKGEQFPLRNGRSILIDPSSPRIDPEKHIEFVADANADQYDPIGMPVHRTPRGRKTVELIGLYLPDQIRVRRKYFETTVRPSYDRVARAKQAEDKVALSKAISDFECLMSWKSEFAGFVRSFARNMKLGEIYGITIPSGVDG